MWFPAMGCSPSGTDCSSVSHMQGHKPCHQTCSSLGSSDSAGLQVLLKCGSPTELQPPLDIHLLQHWNLCGLQVDVCSAVDCGPPQVAGRQHGLLCSSAWSTSSSSFFTDLGVYRAVSHTFSLLSLAAIVQRFLLLLKSIIPEALPPSLMGFTMAHGTA